MKLYARIGNYVFDYIAVNILIFIAAILFFPLYALYVGLIGFYDADSQYKKIFKDIRDNARNILIITLLIMILGGSAYLIEVIQLSGNDGWYHDIFQYAMIGMIIILLIYPPIIMHRMHVTFKELLQNSFYLVFSQFKLTCLMVLLTGLLIWMMASSLFAALLIVPWIQSIHYVSKIGLENEKNKNDQKKEIENEKDSK